MPDTFSTLAGIVLLLLPGALYVAGYERKAGRWRVDSPDRLIHYFGVSIVLAALAAPVTFWAWHHYWHSGILKREHHLPLWPYVLLLAFIFVPLALGYIVGACAMRRVPIVRRIHERTPPRAWDGLFDEPLNGWIRVRTKAGTWVGGALDEDAVASTYPSDGDILFTVASVDPDTGEFVRADDGEIELQSGSQVLIRWSEIEYLQVNAVKEGQNKK
jgi:hypothetical protein